MVFSGEVRLFELHICSCIFNPVFTSVVTMEYLQNRNKLSFGNMRGRRHWKDLYSVLKEISISLDSRLKKNDPKSMKF